MSNADEKNTIITLQNHNTLIDSPNNLLAQWIINPYIAAATSENTRKAYRSDIRHYEQWGGKLPATPELIVMYLQHFATLLNARTLRRRLIAIKHWHTYQNFPDPTLNALVVKTIIGITRIHSKPKKKARALIPSDLQAIAKVLHLNNSLLAQRDNALLQIGFFGALRRSEIINIRYEHIKWDVEGIEILLPASKTDQMHEGQYCVIPYGNAVLCPVNTLETWLSHAHIQEGFIFRRIYKNHILVNGLTPLSVNHIIQRCAHAANLTYAHEFSSHSLRRGLATSAARANSPIQTIMRAGRWKQVNTVMEYIEAAERFTENAAVDVLQKIQSSNAKK